MYICIFVCMFIYFILLFRTILLSIISLLNEPNTFSPANVDASVMYRKWRDSKGKDKEYENIIRSVHKKIHVICTIVSDHISNCYHVEEGKN